MILVPPSSPYSELASLREFDFGATVRGVELEEFELAFSLYREGRYEESIGLFERYIRAFPRSALLEYAHYSAGASYLRWSEWRFMSFFIGFDRKRVQNGMDHLRTVVQISGNSRLLEDTHWLIAKGHLMLSDPGPAMDELYLLMQMEGARRDEAAGMIGGLQAIQQKR
jgi:outer membrane protein assembly factor BamD (BamD/ComL family)